MITTAPPSPDVNIHTPKPIDRSGFDFLAHLSDAEAVPIIEQLTDLADSREEYIKGLHKQSKKMTFGKTIQKKVGRRNLTNTRFMDFRANFKNALENIISHDDMIFNLVPDSGIKSGDDKDEAIELFLAKQRKLIEQSRIETQTDSKWKAWKKDKIEKYQSLSRKKKIAYGLGSGALLGVGLGAVGFAAATGGAIVASRGLRGYASAKRYREGPGADVVTAEFVQHIKSDDFSESDQSRVDYLIEDSEKYIEQDQKANTKAVLGAVGAVAIGGAIGWGARELIGEAFFNDDGGGSPDAENGSNANSDFVFEDPYEHYYDDMEPVPPETGITDGAAETELTHESDTSTDQPPATNYETREFSEFTDTVDHGDGFTHVIRDLAKAEGLEDLTPKQLYHIYELHEDQFAAMEEAYDMGNGDYGINQPGQITISAELRESLVNRMYETLGIDPNEAFTADVDPSAVLDSDETASAQLDESSSPEFGEATNSLTPEENVEDLAGAGDVHDAEIQSTDATNDNLDQSETQPEDTSDENSSNSTEESVENDLEIEYKDNIDEVIADINPDSNPWISARKLSAETRVPLFEKAISIFENQTGMVAEIEYSYDPLDVYNVKFDGNPNWGTHWTEINKILIDLAKKG